jgi:hypothetical protein
MFYLISKNTNEDRYKKVLFVTENPETNFLPDKFKDIDYDIIEIQDNPHTLFENGFMYDTIDNCLVSIEKASFLMDAEAYKIKKIQDVSEESFRKRKMIIPDYKLTNASLGVYEQER